MRLKTIAGAAVVAGAVTFGYASVIERNWFALRRFEIPVLPAGAEPVRILHYSDIHLTPGRHRLLSFLRTLAALEPDLVVCTGDSIAHKQAIPPLLDALGPLLDCPGLFVFGSNDLYSPQPKSPSRYFRRLGPHERRRHHPDLPWAELGASYEAAGWLNLNNRRGRIKAGGLDIEVGGVHDAHIRRDRYQMIAGPTDPTADLRLGVMHSPEPAVMDRFVADGYDLLLAGHTHGGQVCLPWLGTIVTNCGLDNARAKGLSYHPDRPAAGRRAFLHVSAGLGTSPYAPVRFACRPEVSLLTLVPRIG